MGAHAVLKRKINNQPTPFRRKRSSNKRIQCWGYAEEERSDEAQALALLLKRRWNPQWPQKHETRQTKPSTSVLSWSLLEEPAPLRRKTYLTIQQKSKATKLTNSKRAATFFKSAAFTAEKSWSFSHQSDHQPEIQILCASSALASVLATSCFQKWEVYQLNLSRNTSSILWYLGQLSS